MRIGIDFDRVLFDTDAFNEYMKQEVDGLHHVDEEPVDENGNYDPGRHAELSGIDVEEVYSALDDLERFLFDDVHELEELEGEKVIVSRGNREFQMMKIRRSGVEKFVDEVVIVEDGSKNVAGIDFLVDDRVEEIDEAMVPGFIFNRDHHTISDLVEKVGQIDG